MRLFAEQYETEYFFSAHCLRNTTLTTVELNKVYRQKDDASIQLLNHIRDGRNIKQTLAELNAMCFRPDRASDAITLTSTNCGRAGS